MTRSSGLNDVRLKNWYEPLDCPVRKQTSALHLNVHWNISHFTSSTYTPSKLRTIFPSSALVFLSVPFESATASYNSIMNRGAFLSVWTLRVRSLTRKTSFQVRILIAFAIFGTSAELEMSSEDTSNDHAKIPKKYMLSNFISDRCRMSSQLLLRCSWDGLLRLYSEIHRGLYAHPAQIRVNRQPFKTNTMTKVK